MLLTSILKLRNSVARKGNEVFTHFEQAYPNHTGSPQSEDESDTGCKTSVRFKSVNKFTYSLFITSTKIFIVIQQLHNSTILKAWFNETTSKQKV